MKKKSAKRVSSECRGRSGIHDRSVARELGNTDNLLRTCGKRVRQEASIEAHLSTLPYFESDELVSGRRHSG